VSVGDDEESLEFAGDVRALNHDWTPGDVPQVPAGYRPGAAERGRAAAPLVARIAVGRVAQRGSRRRTRSRRAVRRPTQRGPDDREPEPPLGSRRAA
jgi:hypothetical protein